MSALTATEPIEHLGVLPRSKIAVMGDSVGRRRLTSVLGADYSVVAAGSSVGGMLDSARDSIEVAVLIGGDELIARGGAVEALRTLRPECPIVVVSKSHHQSLIRKALRAGVNGLVPQAEAERTLPLALDAVIAGQLSVPRAIRDRPAWDTLSIRERQVLQLVADGLTNSEVAARLYLSESTVKSHLSSSFRKLGVTSRAEAASVVLDPESGLVASSPESPLVSLERELFAGIAA